MATRKKQTTVQQDQLREAENRGFFDPRVLHADGKLNPGAWDGGPTEITPFAADSERVARFLEMMLNMHHSSGGQYEWIVGIFSERDMPQRLNQEGWAAAGMSMFGEWLTPELTRATGLEIYEGCLCWPGRGGDTEKHFLCLYRKDKWEERTAIQEQAIEQRLTPPIPQDGPAGAEKEEKWHSDVRQVETEITVGEAREMRSDLFEGTEPDEEGDTNDDN